MMMNTAAQRTKMLQVGSKFQWLDVRGAGLSMLERLCLEECLLHHDERNWIIVGTHEAQPHKYLQSTLNTPTTSTTNTAIIMGFSGKPQELLNVNLVQQDSVLTIKRFSGGGTVVLDWNSIWVSIIGRPGHFVPEAFPRPIMEWTADALYSPMFQRLSHRNQSHQDGDNDKENRKRAKQSTLVLDTKSCGSENTGKTISLQRPLSSSSSSSSASSSTQHTTSPFRLYQNDYVLGDRKIGGNAQAIVKAGWIHHTSFLWDYDKENMAYLQLPRKRPDYRGDRGHDDFLMRIGDHYPNLHKRDFMECLKEVVFDSFEAETSTTREALETFQHVGGMNEFFQKKSRNRLLTSTK